MTVAILALASPVAALAPAPPKAGPEQIYEATIPKDQSVTISYGEEVTLEVTSPRHLKIIDRRPSPERLDTSRPLPAAGTVRITVQRGPDKENFAVMAVANGLDYPLRYFAVFLRAAEDGGMAGPSQDVCPVAVGRTGFESWPDTPKAMLVFNLGPMEAGDTACR